MVRKLISRRAAIPLILTNAYTHTYTHTHFTFQVHGVGVAHSSCLSMSVQCECTRLFLQEQRDGRKVF